MINYKEFFSIDSPLKDILPGYKPRIEQEQMAQAVSDAIKDSDKLVVEAGTGTGKTFAYLIPALMSNQKTIISTGTKSLQDQLYHRDLPLVGKALGRPIETALLKGRENYLCPNRLDQLTDLPDTLINDLQEVQKWRHLTKSGDKAELIKVPEYSPIWSLVTSNKDSCLGKKCPKCFASKARKKAQEADLVVVNHHLLLSDLAMKESGFLDFLPSVDVFIIDEAHQIPDLAIQFFGVSVGSRELEKIVDEARVMTMPFSQVKLSQIIDNLSHSIKDLRLSAPHNEGRYEFEEILNEIDDPLKKINTNLSDLISAICNLKDASVDLEKLNEKINNLKFKLETLSSDDPCDGLRWMEVHPRSLRLHLTPLDVSEKLGKIIVESFKSWVFTSATLAIAEDFSHFISRMGIDGVKQLSFPSPFPLQKNGLIFLPKNMPEPSDWNHTSTMLSEIIPLLNFTNGGMFCLFTSHRALNKAKKWFKSNKKSLCDRELFSQGDTPRNELLRRFRKAGNAVLLGTSSFWEGVDVRGQALTIVVIDKLPFVSPSDPLMIARLEFIRRQGGNGFMEHQLPLAALSLKQGAGRLLRDYNDFGVIVLCDPRITTKGYGKIFLDCLSPMPYTSKFSEISNFLTSKQ